MNSKDILLCVIMILLSLIIYLLIYDSNSTMALVYYENKEILKIDLTDKSLREYTVDGYNGNVVIETVDGKVRVKEEISPKHLCSKQGYISLSGETIICLPNKIVIKINNDEVDTVVSVWN